MPTKTIKIDGKKFRKLLKQKSDETGIKVCDIKKQLMKKCKCGKQNMSLYCQGKTRPSYMSLVILRDYFGLNQVDELMKNK